MFIKNIKFLSLIFMLFLSYIPGQAMAIALPDAVPANMNLVESGNSKLIELVDNSFAKVYYDYAIYKNNDSVLIAVFALAPEGYYWMQGKKYPEHPKSNPFNQVVSGTENWNSKKNVRISGDTAIILEYRQANNTDFMNNASNALNMNNLSIDLATIPEGAPLNSKQLMDYLPKLEMRIAY